jgi:hypothetical protein
MSAQGRANIRAGIAKRMASKGGEAPAAPSTVVKTRTHKANGKLSVRAAVLKALESGESLIKKELVQKVTQLRGKTTKLGTLNPILNQMKNKDKAIASPARGVYKRK